MTQEEKRLLLIDLCARLPYGVRCHVPTENEESMVLTGKRLNYFCFHKDSFGLDYSHEIEVVLDPWNSDSVIKPYLRPMSSITEEEKNYMEELSDFKCTPDKASQKIDFYNSHHIDYRGLIPMGLALEAPIDMYNTKQ